MKPSSVFEAICESLVEMPQGCVEELGLDKIIVLPPRHAPFIGGAVIFLLVAAFVICFFYRRQLRRQAQMEMKRHVQTAVSQYIAFREEPGAQDKETTGLSEESA